MFVDTLLKNKCNQVNNTDDNKHPVERRKKIHKAKDFSPVSHYDGRVSIIKKCVKYLGNIFFLAAVTQTSR